MNSPSSAQSRILIVDDEEVVRNLLFDILSEEYECLTASSAEEALRRFETESFGLVVSDINLGGMTGVEMIPFVHSRSPDSVVMMISGSQTIDSAIHAMRLGAYDYIRKPFDIDHVLASVKRAITHHELLVSKREHEENLEQLVKERTARVEFLTLHDPLTNLPNRLLVEDRLGRLILKSEQDEMVAVMLVALDRVHIIRDTLGASAVDEVLLKAAERIESEIGTSATVGRFDGEVFALVVPNTSTEEVVTLASRLVDALNVRFKAGDKEVFLRPCLGISLYPTDGADVQELLKKAGLALSEARELSGPSARFYRKGVNDFANRRLAFENDLRHAVDRGELIVHYQPKVGVTSGRVVGAEALVRWAHPERGMVSPGEFITVAETIGIIGKIGESVLRTACSDFAKIADAGLSVAVNVSIQQLTEAGFAEIVSGVLSETGMPAACLNLEVTETSVMHNPEVSIAELTKLRDLGTKVSLDDFGTGYSSLNALKDLPIDVLKIDQSFVADVTADTGNAAFIKTIVDLAKNLGLGVVAEGVETNEQLILLSDLNCDEYQGYLFSRPVPFDDFRRIAVTGEIHTEKESKAGEKGSASMNSRT